MAGDRNSLSTLLVSLCAEIGAEIVFEPGFRRAGHITFRAGHRRFFKGSNFDFNLSAAARIAQDKDFCAGFLRMAGLNCPESRVSFAPKCIAGWKAKNPDLAAGLDSFAPAFEAAEIWGFPLFVKPNEGAEGNGVQLVHDSDRLRRHLDLLHAEHDRVLIQKPVRGRDYRLVVLDGETILAYRRKPLEVVGNGRDAIGRLLARKARSLSAAGRRAVASADDPRIVGYLAARGLTVEHVPESGRAVRLLANANLSAGGDAVDVTDALDERYAGIARRAAEAVGLRFAGVDILCAAPDRFDPCFCVLEVNAAPSLDNFAATGKRAHDRVAGLYRALLRKMSRMEETDG